MGTTLRGFAQIIHFDPTTGDDFVIEADPDAGGSWLQGHIAVSHVELVSAFGAPTHNYSSDGKVQCEWDLRINGVACTIYDWKEDRAPERVRDWHIGGTTPQAVQLVRGALEAWRKSQRVQ